VHAIALDSKYGVPTVAIHTNVFEKAVQSVTRMHGMSEARYTFVPQPVMGKTAEQLRAYVDGKSPISGRPVMQDVHPPQGAEEVEQPVAPVQAAIGHHEHHAGERECGEDVARRSAAGDQHLHSAGLLRPAAFGAFAAARAGARAIATRIPIAVSETTREEPP